MSNNMNVQSPFNMLAIIICFMIIGRMWLTMVDKTSVTLTGNRDVSTTLNKMTKAGSRKGCELVLMPDHIPLSHQVHRPRK